MRFHIIPKSSEEAVHIKSNKISDHDMVQWK